MKAQSLLKKCFIILVFLGIIGMTNLNAQTAFTVGDLNYRINDDGVSVTVTGHVDGENASGELIIPESVNYNGNYYIVNSIDYNAFQNCSGLTGSLIFPNTITTIGAYAFQNCSGFTGSLTIPNSVTSIDHGVFENCTGFNGNLTLSNSLTAIRGHAFRGCSNMTGNLIIPDSLTIIGTYAFSGCHSFTGSLTIPDNVTSIESFAFSYCSGLNGCLTISHSVTTIATDAFCSCNFTGFLNIPNSVTCIESSAFANCSGFTGSLIIPNNVTYIGDHAFANCSGFTGSLIIPNNVTYIGDSAFSHCSNLSDSMTIPNSVKRIGRYAFFYCSGLIHVNIPYSVISIGKDAFHYTGWFNSQPNGIVYLNNWCLGWKGSKPSGALVLNDGIIGIADEALTQCSTLTGLVTMPNSLRIIGFEAFYDCNNLTGFSIPASVFVIGGGAFDNTGWYNNQSDGILYLDNWCLGYKGSHPTGTLVLNDGTIGIADYAFAYCSELTGSLTLPNSIVTIGEGAFWGCTGFSGSLTIPNSVTTISKEAFMFCEGFAGTLVIGNSVTTVGEKAFKSCVGITDISLPNTIIEIGYEAFIYTDWYNNYNYQGDNIMYLDHWCLGYGSGHDIVIKEGTIGIANSAFYSSEISVLQGNLTIPSSIKYIGSFAFGGCRMIVNVLSKSSTPPVISESVFVGISEDCNLIVPCGLTDKYIQANWNNSFNLIIEDCSDVTELDENIASVYPNPTSNIVKIEADNIQNVVIYNMLGEMVFELSTSGNEFEYDFSNNESGVYLVRVKTAQGVVTKRVTVM